MSKKNVKVNEFRYATIEEAKVPNVMYEYHPTGRKGFIKVDDTLVAVEVRSVTINLKTQEVVSSLRDGNNTEYIREGLYDLYHVKEDYEDGITWGAQKAGADSLMKCDKRTKDVSCHVIDIESLEGGEKKSNIYPSAWVFKDGEAVEVPIDIITVMTTYGSGWKITEGYIPEEMWGSREAAYSHNEYLFVDEDGEEFTQRGVNLRLKPTKKQTAILEKLKYVFEEAKNAGLKFAWDRESCCNIGAFNGNEVVEYGYEIESNGGDIVPILNVDLIDTGINFYDYCGCDSCERLELKMTPYQEKIMKKRESNAE